MNINHQPPGIRRRSLVIFSMSCIGLVSNVFAAGRKPIAAAAPFVLPKLKWTPNHLHGFIKALPKDARLTLKKSLEVLPSGATVANLMSGDQDAKDIQKRVLWLSSNILTYPFKTVSNLDYHAMVTWVAAEAGVNKPILNSASTFTLERELFKMLFAQLWDKMTAKQREDLLKKVDSAGLIKDKAAMAALGGAGALAALSTTVAFTGFAFYTTMSVAIASVAGAMGVVLPFAVYGSAASLIGILSGPIGWAIMGISAIGGMALAGRANLQKTTAFVAQIHALKVEALAAAGVPEKSVF
jgi:hypothetical protein